MEKVVRKEKRGRDMDIKTERWREKKETVAQIGKKRGREKGER